MGRANIKIVVFCSGLMNGKGGKLPTSILPMPVLEALHATWEAGMWDISSRGEKIR
jgi:hypothetical protein